MGTKKSAKSNSLHTSKMKSFCEISILGKIVIIYTWENVTFQTNWSKG